MYRVVIIDDEPIIAEGLSKMIRWEDYNCVVAACAYDGEEGMTAIRNSRPHIIISDIRMPRMDGLTMLAAVRSEFSNTQIVILTGYRDFDYAHQAIALGVNRFLLKPSKMEELREAISFSVNRLHDLNITGEEKSSDEVILYDAEASSFIVKKAVVYIEEHYRDRLRLADVAEQVYVSQWHLSKLLNHHVGHGFSEILSSIRIEKAKELLKDPALRIGDIAEEVGFMDMSHFSRVFKRITGISANEFRNTRSGL